jgi:hypothetical protein
MSARVVRTWLTPNQLRVTVMRNAPHQLPPDWPDLAEIPAEFRNALVEWLRSDRPALRRAA